MSGSVHTQLSNTRIVQICAGVALAMLCLGLAAKPLYDTFCRVTGYGGTVRTAEENLSTAVLDREILVRFDANVNPNLDWEFKPKANTAKVKLGQNLLVYYTAKNLSDKVITGTASYNVSPIKAAPYFSKIECFCFTEQLLQPGEEVVMPVLFFVDPLLADSERHDDVKMITLSYTFHRVDAPHDYAETTADRAAKLQRLQAVEQGFNAGAEELTQ